jgi:excisionase family DNA binding protein
MRKHMYCVIVHLGDVLTVQQAAERLALPTQRVRELLAREELAGERVGSMWVISTEDVERLLRRKRPVGRAFGKRQAWAVIHEVEPTLTKPALANEEQRRAIRHVKRPFEELVPRLRRRAGLRYLSVDRQRLQALSNDSRCLIGGPEAARKYGVRTAPEQPVELYLRASDVEAIEDAYLTVPDRRFANLVLRMIEDPVWPFPDIDDVHHVPPAVVGLDLADAQPSEISTARTLWMTRAYDG